MKKMEVRHLTRILDKYPEAKYVKELMPPDDTKEIYKVINGSDEYVLKLVNVDSRDDKTLKQLQIEYESAKKLGDEHPHFVKCMGFETLV